MAVSQSMKWAAVIAGLRALGLDDERIASEAESTPERIKLMAKGRCDPEPISGMRLRRMEVRYRRAGGVPTPPKPPCPERGVYDLPAPAEYESHVVISSAGIPAIEMRVHKSFIGNRDLVAGLRKWLNEADPTLKLMGDGA